MHLYGILRHLRIQITFIVLGYLRPHSTNSVLLSPFLLAYGVRMI